MNPTIIYLIGFMGAGKTSVGRRLGEILGWQFIDLDEVIEQREGRSIREIFEQEGEPYFRNLESKELERTGTGRQLVVALGGGAFCSEQNQKVIEKNGASIWLDAPIEVLYARCVGETTRPLLTTREKMAALLEKRRPLYAQADKRMDVSGRNIEAIAAEIVRYINSCIKPSIPPA